MFKRYFIYFLILIISCLAVSIFAGEIHTENEENIGLLATVNGSPVTLTDVLEICGYEESRLPLMYSGNELNKNIEKIRLKALNAAIDRKLIYADFEAQGFKLPDRFVNENLDYLIKMFNVDSRQELEKIFASQGKSMAEFKANAYENAAIDAYIYNKVFKPVYITPRDLFDYYNEHRDEFTTPAKIKLSIISLKTNGVHAKEIDQLSETLKNSFANSGSESFSDAVILYSDGPNLDKKGDIGWIELAELRSDFSDVVKGSKKGEIIGPVKLKEAYYFIKIDDLKEAVSAPFPDVKEEIDNKLSSKQREERYKSFVKDLRKNAYIQYFVPNAENEN